METRSIKAPSPPAAHRSPPSQSEAPGRTPASDVDPFSIEFFEDPFPVHESLREAGPVVWLSRYGVWAVARYQEVHAVLNAIGELSARAAEWAWPISPRKSRGARPA